VDQFLPDISAVLHEFLCDRTLRLTASTRFEDLPGWDSMDLISVVVELECRFDILFDLPEIDDLITIGDLHARIVDKVALTAA
jgi:acyl carrier protein